MLTRNNILQGNKKICKFYINGYCNFGSRCYNLHHIPKKNPVVKSNSKNIKCKDYYENVCKYTEQKCQYSHTIDSFNIDILCFKHLDQHMKTSILFVSRDGIIFNFAGSKFHKNYLIKFYSLDRIDRIDSSLNQTYYGGDFNDVICNFENIKNVYNIFKYICDYSQNFDITQCIITYLYLLTVKLPIIQYTRINEYDLKTGKYIPIIRNN